MDDSLFFDNVAVKFWEIFNNTFLQRTPPVTVPVLFAI